MWQDRYGSRNKWFVNYSLSVPHQIYSALVFLALPGRCTTIVSTNRFFWSSQFHMDSANRRQAVRGVWKEQKLVLASFISATLLVVAVFLEVQLLIISTFLRAPARSLTWWHFCAPWPVRFGRGHRFLLLLNLMSLSLVLFLKSAHML